MEKYIKIESKGVVDPKAFFLIGASTKRGDDSKIGFFGSGLKYSVAFLLRNNIKFKVFADYAEIKFKTKPSDFREQSFDVIWIDKKETSMTTEMGMDWEHWSVIREIFSNAIDEGDNAISVVKKSECVPVEDKTVFYIEVTPQMQEIITNWDLYFTEKRKDLLYSDTDSNQLYIGGDGLVVYRKGIRCLYTKEEKPIFNYDLSWVEINESRSIKNEWDFKYALTKFLQAIADETIVAQIINLVNKRWEANLNWHCSASCYSEMWLAVIRRRILVPYENAGFWDKLISESPSDYLILPAKMITGLKDRFLDKVRVVGDSENIVGDGTFMAMSELSERQTHLLDESKRFLADAEYEIKYPMLVVEFVNKLRLGQALNEQILLSTKLFEKGTKQIVACIIEENEHLLTGFSDESRDFQNHWISKYVSALEDKTGKYL